MPAARTGLRRGLGMNRSVAKRHKSEGRGTIFLCGLCVWYEGSSKLELAKVLALTAGRPWQAGLSHGRRAGNEALSCLLRCLPRCHRVHVQPLARLCFLLWGLARKRGQNPFWLFKTVSFPPTPYLPTGDFKSMKS